jgi:hypothetical protein
MKKQGTLQIFIKRNPKKYKALRRPISRTMNKQDESLKTTREKE